MTLINESDFVRACNAEDDLRNLGIRFLTFYRKYCNGVNNVVVPNEPFTTITKQPKLENNTVKIVFVILFVEHYTHSTPTYYSPDDDMFVEGYGSGNHNISGFQTSHHASQRSLEVHIPWKDLLLSDDHLKEYLTNLYNKDKKNKEDLIRKEKIESLKSQLKALEIGN